MELLDMTVFMDNGLVREKDFFEKLESFDWSTLTDKRVLVKGCGTTAIPPWAFMAIMARLADRAKTVKYGNEHSSITVYRRISNKQEITHAAG